MALFDAFLKIDGIKGESADAKHKGEIDVMSFSWGLAPPPPGRNGNLYRQPAEAAARAK